MDTIRQLLIRLHRDDRGLVLTIESVLLATICLFGLAAGTTALRDAVISEFSDVAGGIQDLNQDYYFESVSSHSGGTTGSDFGDESDFCDSADDVANQTDNCITFDGLPSDERIFLAESFEEGIDPTQATRTFGGGPLHAYLFDSADVPGWQTTASDDQIELWDSGFGGVVSQDGDYHAEINANQNAQLFQEFDVLPGETIEYSIWHRGRSGVDVANVMIGPPGAQTIHQTMSTDNTSWVNYSGTYTVPTGVTTLRIGFEAVSTATGSPSVGNFVDNLEVRRVN